MVRKLVQLPTGKGEASSPDPERRDRRGSGANGSGGIARCSASGDPAGPSSSSWEAFAIARGAAEGGADRATRKEGGRGGGSNNVGGQFFLPSLRSYRKHGGTKFMEYLELIALNRLLTTGELS